MVILVMLVQSLVKQVCRHFVRKANPKTGWNLYLPGALDPGQKTFVRSG
jgi:hypothetical protein